MAKDKAQARREQLAKARAEQKRKERRATLLMWGAGGLVILVIVGVVAFYLINERSQSALDDVAKTDYPGSLHVETKVSYKENPPMGGEHNPAWQNCGIYDEPINNENAVHSMEHGAVWITYRPDLPAEQVARLKELAEDDYMLLSPYPGLPSAVVATSWNNQLRLPNADDPRLPRFIQRYKNGPDTPELGAACDQGISETAAQNPLPSAAPSQSAQPSAPATPMPSGSPSAEG